MKLFDSAFGIHQQALDLRGQQMEVIARNIANSDTPHFKARDLDFKAVLNETQSVRAIWFIPFPTTLQRMATQ
jgi:flagellar basal-body rod protein FlgB